MANTLAPFGFVQYLGNGSVPTYEQVSMKIASSNTTAIFFGDAVTPVTSSVTGYITKTAAASTTPLAGVFVGCKYLSTAQKRVVWSNYWPGSDTSNDVEAYVVNDPNAQFKVQCIAGPLTAASVGRNVDIDTTTSGSTATGISGMAVSATAASTSTLPFRIVSLLTNSGVAIPNGAPPPGSNGTDAASAYNYVIVAFNNIQTRAGATSV
jgi:hypothetical protein